MHLLRVLVPTGLPPSGPIEILREFLRHDKPPHTQTGPMLFGPVCADDWKG